MKRRRRNRAKNSLRKRTRRGYRGHPVATIAYYGPDDQRAIRVSVGIIDAEGAPARLRRWYGEPDQDVRHDAAVHQEILAHVDASQSTSVVLLETINGCACLEDEEMPARLRCPTPCTFWHDVERPSDRIQRLARALADEEE